MARVARGSLRDATRRVATAEGLFFADIFVPQSWIRANEIGQHLDAFRIGQINHFDSVFAQPDDSTLEILRLAYDYRADAELAD